MGLKQFLDETVPEFKKGCLSNTKEAYEHEYDAAFEYYKGFGFTNEDREELKDRGFDLNQETAWEGALNGEKNADLLQEIKRWRYTTLMPLTKAAKEIQKHCSLHTEPARYGCYFSPDVSALADLCGFEKVRMVVANHVRIHTGPKDNRSRDGRYDDKVRAWAWTVPEIPKSPRAGEERPFYEIGLGDLHATLCDALASSVMDYEKEHDLKLEGHAAKKKARAR